VTQLTLSSWRGRTVGYDVRVYIVDGVLIDTGFPGARAELLDALRTLAPRGAVVTHWHEDHAGNVPALAAQALPLYMHPSCEATLRARPSIRAYRALVWGQTDALTAPLVPFDPAPLRVIHAPGHSPDHLVVWDEERRILASGDVFLGVKVRVAHHDESPRVLLESLRAIVVLEPRLLLDGHRGAVKHPVELLRSKIAWLEETIGLIVSLAERGVGEREIQRRVLGAEAFIGVASFGEYSKIGFVRAVLGGL
jgi:glyoxylase-like metal-dependent hydrolase (beta-lactamase superfamily II)